MVGICDGCSIYIGLESVATCIACLCNNCMKSSYLKALQGTVTKLLPCVGFRIEAQECQAAQAMLLPLLEHPQPGFWQVTSHLWKEKVEKANFPNGSVGQQSACNAGDRGNMGSIPGSGRSPGGGNGNPLQFSFLKNPMGQRAWQATPSGVAKKLIWLSMHTCLCTRTHTHTQHSYSQLIQPFFVSKMTFL